MGLLSSLFGGGKPNEDQQAKQGKENFEILKYDVSAHAICASFPML